MTDLKRTIPTKLLWVDLEMTGLDVTKDVILEIAIQVTDFDFKTLATYDAVIHHPDQILDAMIEWPATQHGLSGLTERVRTEGRAEADVRRELARLVKDNFGDEPAVLAGNSIHNDRNFIKRWWPEVDALLHYRMLDVSSFKILMQAKYALSEYKKTDTHRAATDIDESIRELRYYLEWFAGNSDKI